MHKARLYNTPPLRFNAHADGDGEQGRAVGRSKDAKPPCSLSTAHQIRAPPVQRATVVECSSPPGIEGLAQRGTWNWSVESTFADVSGAPCARRLAETRHTANRGPSRAPASSRHCLVGTQKGAEDQLSGVGLPLFQKHISGFTLQQTRCFPHSREERKRDAVGKSLFFFLLFVIHLFSRSFFLFLHHPAWFY